MNWLNAAAREKDVKIRSGSSRVQIVVTSVRENECKLGLKRWKAD